MEMRAVLFNPAVSCRATISGAVKRGRTIPPAHFAHTIVATRSIVWNSLQRKVIPRATMSQMMFTAEISFSRQRKFVETLPTYWRLRSLVAERSSLCIDHYFPVETYCLSFVV